MSTFFSQASHLAYHYRHSVADAYLFRSFSLCRAFLRMCNTITLFAFFQIPGEKKLLFYRLLEQCSHCRTRASQSRKRKRKDLYLEGCVCMCIGMCVYTWVRCRTCNCVIPSKRLNKSSTKAQLFFSFFFCYLISQDYA